MLAYDWYGIVASAYKDKEGEYISKRALNSFYLPPSCPLVLWHDLKMQIGMVDFVLPIWNGKYLLTGGSLIQKYHQELYAVTRRDKWQMSFMFFAKAVEEGNVITDVDIVEMTIVPAPFAINMDTHFIVRKPNATTL